MRVVEVFDSIQGEGPQQGRVATFIRLAGCNLKCSFCDTPYAQKAGDEMPISDVRDKMVVARECYGSDHLFVITGGEPMVQAPDLFMLLGNYFARSAKRANVAIETNGTIAPSRELLVRFTPKFVVSPKKGNINAAALKALALADSDFKFVIDPRGVESFTMDEARAIWNDLELPASRIWLQPMAKDKKTLGSAGRWVWEQCVKHGVNYSPRLHVSLYGDKRGV